MNTKLKCSKPKINKTSHSRAKMATGEKVVVLNPDPPKENGTISALKLSQTIQKTMLRMKGECIQEDGKGVDYEKLNKSPYFQSYKQDVAQLHNVDLSVLTEPEKKAFFINLYNALTIHGLGEQASLPDSVLDVKQFWRTTCYNIGGHVYSLDDIEHGILRVNRPHPASIEPQFSAKDPRVKFILQTFDPRIHFALVCGAVSCPAINVYTEKDLDMALDSATRNFCQQEVSMFTESDEIWMSKIFQWYRDDFGKSEVEVIEWIKNYLDIKTQERAHVMLFKLQNVGNIDIKYSEYDWRLNVLGSRPINL